MQSSIIRLHTPVTLRFGIRLARSIATATRVASIPTLRTAQLARHFSASRINSDTDDLDQFLLNPRLRLKSSLGRTISARDTRDLNSDKSTSSTRTHSTTMSTELPQKIKAVVASEPGGIEKIQLVELPFPVQKPNEVVVKVQYAGVNFIDTYLRGGIYPPKELPIRLGMEASGVVVKLPTDESLKSNEDYTKRQLNVGDRVVLRQVGSFATHLSVPWTNIHRVPSSITPLTAVASFLQGLTALTFLTESHPVQAGETILVHTIAGGLGLLFLQFAKRKGATVIGTTSTKEKAELAKSLGADHVILYTEEDTVKRVLEITNGEGVHAVFDGVGKDTFDANFKLLRRKGTLVSVGNASGVVPPFAPLKLTEKNLKLLRPTLNNYIVTAEESFRYVSELFQLLESGVQVKVHKIYPFSAEGVQQAQTDITGRSTSGKLIVAVDESV